MFGKRNLRNLTVEDEKPTRFNRVGLLAHPYMLGPSGDSNGCVSFKTYDVFLRASQNGVKRLAVVARWTGGPRQVGTFASLSQGLSR